MIQKYTTNALFNSPDTLLERFGTLLFNSDHSTFSFLRDPSLGEIRELIDAHADFRLTSQWRNLMEVTKDKPNSIYFFDGNASALYHVKRSVWSTLGFESFDAMREETKRLSLEDQRKIAGKARPSNINEMQSLFFDGDDDIFGYAYFHLILKNSATGIGFFEALIEDILTPLVNGTKPHKSHKRAFELLGMAWERMWLLFPFLYGGSPCEYRERFVAAGKLEYYFNQGFLPESIVSIIENARIAETLSGADAASKSRVIRNLSYLMLCSTFRGSDHIRLDFLERALDVINQSQEDGVAQYRRSYNRLIAFRNEHAPGAPLPLLTLPAVTRPPSLRIRLAAIAAANPIVDVMEAARGSGRYAFEYVTHKTFESFESDLDGAPPTLFNVDTERFTLLKTPNKKEIKLLIDEHAQFRRDTYWDILMTPKSGHDYISLFVTYGKATLRVPFDMVKEALGVSNYPEFMQLRTKLSLAEQRKLVEVLKPKSIDEMLKIYQDRSLDETGYSYFTSILDRSESGHEFFGALIDILVKSNSTARPEPEDEQNGQKYLGHRSQARTLELLGMAWAKGWLLFPFMHRSSKSAVAGWMMHGKNMARYFHPDFLPIQLAPLLEELSKYESTKTTDKNILKDVTLLTLCSTFRTFEQLSNRMLKKAFDIVQDGSDSSHSGMVRKAYNAIIRLRNAKVNAYSPIELLVRERGAVSLDDFHSMEHLRISNPELGAWADAFEEFLTSIIDGQYISRRAAINDVAEFLSQLKDAPKTPLKLLRRHINELKTEGNSFRNWLAKIHSSARTKNERLTFLSQFYEYLGEKCRLRDPGAWLRNPVDMRFDRFSQVGRAGTQRVTIPANIISTMRSILVEDDYAWPKKMTNWGYLVDKTTGSLEYVWCPSSTTLLYTLLTVPIRSIQGRMFDTGEGDSEIFDFDSGLMVANTHQLPVNGKLERRRKEGFLQIMESGMGGVEPILGLWIPVNKTSDDGYAIPWVSDDLLKHLRYQRDWIFRYSDRPNMHTINDAQGHRNTPDELADRGGSYYCLFRDAISEKTHDHSLPVSKQALMKLWGQLCVETQRRMNSSLLGPDVDRIRLVEPGTENNYRPSTLHDLHTLRVSGITDLLDRGVPLNIVSEYIAGHATYVMTLWYDKPTPSAIRYYMQNAEAIAGEKYAPIPNFSQDQLIEQQPHLVSHHDYSQAYNGFDALEDLNGLALVRQSGICPGTRCSEGSLDDSGRAKPVPTGDRGPSCPQCRFWLTGPAFLLGQTIEGNQLIYKIRRKVQSLSGIREKIMDAEDRLQIGRADGLRAQADVEERQLNDMLTEWWHRMRFYEASKKKLDSYRKMVDASAQTMDSDRAPVRLGDLVPEPDWSVKRASELELNHFLSTAAELLPEYSLDTKSAQNDIEIAVAKFISINDGEIAKLHFTMDDRDRLTAANLTVGLLLDSCRDGDHAARILEGREKLDSLPRIKSELSAIFDEIFSRSVQNANSTSDTGALT